MSSLVLDNVGPILMPENVSVVTECMYREVFSCVTVRKKVKGSSSG
jgi:hypothetical protein